jgi:hypothetical protein
MVFFLSFVVHVLSELGLTNEMVTATFYKQVQDSDTENDDRSKFKYPNMQVVLLTVSCMYFVLGSTLEYIRRSEIIISGIILIFGGLKLSTGIYFLVLQSQNADDTDPDQSKFKDIEVLELNEGITHLLVSMRFSLVTIFIIGLAKWFTRPQLPLVFGLWFVNESIAHLINWSVLKDEYLYITSGAVLILMAPVFYRYYRIDPIDSGLIINE